MRKKIIISADDFGKSELANRNILRLAEAGKLQRVSVMSNGNFASDEIARIVKTGTKLDIHLDLADVPQKEKKLKQGILKRGILFFLKHFGSLEYRQKKIREKWERQIEKFRELFNRYPDGLNSHQHVYLFGRYFRIALKLAKKFEINYIRFAKVDLLGSSTSIRKVIYFLWKKDKKHAAVNNFKKPDYFVSLDWIKNLDKFLKNLPEGEIEIACHPEREDEAQLVDKYF